MDLANVACFDGDVCSTTTPNPEGLGWNSRYFKEHVLTCMHKSIFIACEALACSIPLNDSLFGNDIDRYAFVSFCGENDSHIPIPGTLDAASDFLEPPDQLVRINPEIASHLENIVKDAVMPDLWVRRGYPAPSADCRAVTLSLTKSIFASFGKIPSSVLPTKEAAINISYRNSDTNTTLYIEVDSDLDAVATISLGNKVVDFGVFENGFVDRAFAILDNGIEAMASNIQAPESQVNFRPISR